MGEEGGGAGEPLFAPHCSPWAPLTHGCADAIALGVNEATNLGEVAVPLCDILYGSGLHEQSVVSCERPLDTLLIVFHQCRGLAAHEGPHLLEGRDLGFLGSKGWEGLNQSYGAPPHTFHSLWSLSMALVIQLCVYSAG